MLLKTFSWILFFHAFNYAFGHFLFRRHITLHDVNGEVVASNCSYRSCVSADAVSHCQTNQICINFTRSDIVQEIQEAESALTPSWFYLDSLTIYCNSLSSDSARSMLIALLDFARIAILELRDCGDLVTSTSTSEITLYGLENLTINSKNKTETLNMRLTDRSASKLIDTYIIRNVAFLSLNTLNLRSKLKAFSIVVHNKPEKLTDPLIKAFDRAPFKDITEINLGTELKTEFGDQFMVTPIYT